MWASDWRFEEIFNERTPDYDQELYTADRVDCINEGTAPPQLNYFNDITVYPSLSLSSTQHQHNNAQYELEDSLIDRCDESPSFQNITSSIDSEKNSICTIPDGSLCEEVTSPFRISQVGVCTGRTISLHNKRILID